MHLVGLYELGHLLLLPGFACKHPPNRVLHREQPQKYRPVGLHMVAHHTFSAQNLHPELVLIVTVQWHRACLLPGARVNIKRV